MKTPFNRILQILCSTLIICPALFGSVQESFVTALDASETLCTHSTESPTQMAAAPTGSGLTWGGYSQATSSFWASNVGVQGANERFILYATANQPAKTANYSGTYIYTIFNMSGGTTPEVTVNLDQIRVYVDASAPGQQVRWLLRDGSGQWFISDDVTSMATEDMWYSIDPSSISWLRVNAAAENDMNQLDAGAKTPIADPATLVSQTPDTTQVTGGGIYLEQGVLGSETDTFIINDFNWLPIPEPVDLYVATNGNDVNPGTEGSPLATLTGARDAIRTGGLAANGVTVYIREGSYRQTSSFSLSSQDSGIPGYPVVYQAYPGEEVIIHGAEALTPAAFVPVTDPAILARLPQSSADKIIECDLVAQGITDYGQLQQAHNLQNAPAELFFNERSMMLAQWPNEGFTRSGNVIRTGSLDPYEGAIFEYTDSRVENWSTYADVWIGGHWNVEMFDMMEVVVVDTNAMTIETLQPPLTWGTPNLKNDRRMFFINVLEELDLPTEYYIDRTAGKLYFYPPDTVTGARIQLSMLEDELINLNGVDHVQFKGLIFEASRHRAIGTSGSSDLLVAGCTFRNLGMNSITCWLGEDILVDSCDFYETGDGGVRTFGGDRQTLVPGNHQVENCHFYNYSRLRRTGSSPARLERVGHKARHCLAHGNWRGEFSFPGNDHLYEYNEINNILKNSNDTAGIGSGFNWTASGTHIRYNFIHNYHGMDTHSIEAVGVYVDDGLSGNYIYQNVFYDLDMAFFSHGGRGTVVDNNLMIDCDDSFYFMDPSLVTWWGSRFATLIDKLDDVPSDQPLYTNKYPHLVTIHADLAANAANTNNVEYQYPKDNVGTKNLIYNSGVPEIPANALTYGTFHDNHEMADGEDAGFIDPDTLNFGLEANSPVFTLIPGFEDIPFAQIGLYTNEYRPALPAMGDFKLFHPEYGASVSTGSPVEFVWEGCLFADEYLLEIATDPDFNDIIQSVTKEDMCYSYVAVTVEGLSSDVTYYWRVRAYTNARSMSLESKVQAGWAYNVLNSQAHLPYLQIALDSAGTHELSSEDMIPFATYQVEQSTNLLETWESFTNFAAPADGNFAIGSISNDQPAVFYRIIQ